MGKQHQPGGKGERGVEEKQDLGNRAAARITLDILEAWGVADDAELGALYRKMATMPLKKLRPEEVTEKIQKNQDILAKVNEIRGTYEERGNTIIERYRVIETATATDYRGLAESGMISFGLVAKIDELNRNIDSLTAQQGELNEEGQGILDQLISSRAKIMEGINGQLAILKQNASEDRERELRELDAQFDVAVRPLRTSAGKAMAYPEVFNAVYQEAKIFQERSAVEQGVSGYREGFAAFDSLATRQGNAVSEIEKVTGLTGVREMMIQAGKDGGQALVELRNKLAQAVAERTDEVVPEKLNPILAPKNGYTKKQAALVANRGSLQEGLKRIAALGDERAKGQLIMLEETELLDGVFASISPWIGDIASRRNTIKFTKEQQDRAQKERDELQKFDHGGRSELKDKNGGNDELTVMNGKPDEAAVQALIRKKGSGLMGRGNDAGSGKSDSEKGDGKGGKRNEAERRLDEKITALIREATGDQLAAKVWIPPQNIRERKIGGHYGAVLVEPTGRTGEYRIVKMVAAEGYVMEGERFTTDRLIEKFSEFRTLIPKQEAGK